MAMWSTLTPYQKAQVVWEINDSVDAGSESVLGACKRVGVDRSTYYRWRERVERYEAGDPDAIQHRSSRPRKHGRRKPDSIRREVVRLARSGRFRSPTAIARYMTKRGSRLDPGTAIRILEEAGLYGFVTKQVPGGKGKKVRRWL